MQSNDRVTQACRSLRKAALASVALIAVSQAMTPESLAASSKKAAKEPAMATPSSLSSRELRLQVLLAEQRLSGKADTPQLRAVIENELARREVLLQEAQKAGADRDALLRTQMEMAGESLLIQAFIHKWAAEHAPPEAEVRKDYDRIIARAGNREVRVRQIVVGDEENAKGVLARLNAGEKFEYLASRVSLDPASRSTGGLLDWVPIGDVVPSLAEAILKLSRGQITAEAVRGPAGWYLLRLEDTRPFTPPPFEKLRGRIAQAMEQKALDAYIAELQRKAGTR